MNKTMALTCFLITASSGFALLGSCGKSLYQPVSSNTSLEAKKQDAIIALDNDDYTTANARLAEIWATQKTDEIAQLYAIAILGDAGINLFKLVQDAIKALTAKSGSTDNDQDGSQILTAIADLVKDTLTDAALLKVKDALGILAQAPTQSSVGIVFQKCLTAGIYAAPSLTSLLTGITDIQSQLQNLPNDLAVVSGSCTAGATKVAEVGASLTSLISRVGTLATRISEVQSVLGSCLPASATDQVNKITTQVSKLLAAADKGCSIPSTQKLGSFELPACMNTFVTATTSDAKADDKIVSGCEVFLNCASGACL